MILLNQPKEKKIDVTTVFVCSYKMSHDQSPTTCTCTFCISKRHNFFLACPIGTYGGACDKICGNCAESAPCHSTTGVCQQGCQPGYMSERCDQSMAIILDLY